MSFWGACFEVTKERYYLTTNYRFKLSEMIWHNVIYKLLGVFRCEVCMSGNKLASHSGFINDRSPNNH